MRVLPSFKCRWHDVSVTVYPADGGFYDVEVIVGESVSERPMLTALEAAMEIGCSLGGDVAGIERQILAWSDDLRVERERLVGISAGNPVYVCQDCHETVQRDEAGMWQSARDGRTCYKTDARVNYWHKVAS